MYSLTTPNHVVRVLRGLLASVFIALLVACGSKGGVSPSVGVGEYRVQRGDTLYKIARQHGQTVDELMRMNSIKDPRRLRVGQIIKVKGGSRKPLPAAGSSTAKTPAQSTAASVAAPRSISLAWPAKGTHKRGTGNQSQGVFIEGKKGDSVNAAAAGRVMYAGSGLRGYGNMVIIAHDNQFLTVYAHNDSLLVKEGQQVKQGQQIARMGDSDSNKVQLYFELRYDGKAVDATRYLPK